MFRLGCKQIRNSRLITKRTLFTVPELTNLDKSRGIPGLYTPEGLDVAWYQYQTHLTNKLNELTKDHPETQDLSTFELMQASSVNPELFEVNFYASQAYNNEFFFSALTDSKNPLAQVREPTEKEQREVNISNEVLNTVPEIAGDAKLLKLKESMKDSFDSELSFRELFINRAAAPFGNGYAWLVGTSLTQYYVLNTYNHGTPFEREDEQYRANSRRGLEAGSNDDIKAKQLVPLINISTWQHAFLTDYGVAGKRKFVENVYDCIDWKVVSKRLDNLSHSTVM